MLNNLWQHFASLNQNTLTQTVQTFQPLGNVRKFRYINFLFKVFVAWNSKAFEHRKLLHIKISFNPSLSGESSVMEIMNSSAWNYFAIRARHLWSWRLWTFLFAYHAITLPNVAPTSPNILRHCKSRQMKFSFLFSLNKDCRLLKYFLITHGGMKFN